MLSYEKYNNRRFAVRGDRRRFTDPLKQLGARWNSRMRGGEGWLVSLEHEKGIKKLISDSKKEDKLVEMQKNGKSRANQSRYHRETSENEISDSEASVNSTVLSLLQSGILGETDDDEGSPQKNESEEEDDDERNDGNEDVEEGDEEGDEEDIEEKEEEGGEEEEEEGSE